MTDDDAPDSPGPEARSPWRVWGPALAAIAAVGLVHWGLWLVLTRDARATVDEVDRQHDAAALEGARKPGQEPEGGSEEWSRWQKNQRLWAEAERRQERLDMTRTLGWSLTVSWALQACIVTWLALRATTGATPRTARTRGRASAE